MLNNLVLASARWEEFFNVSSSIQLFQKLDVKPIRGPYTVLRTLNCSFLWWLVKTKTAGKNYLKAALSYFEKNPLPWKE